MLMLSCASEITRENLARVPTPEPTDTWRPIPHIEVVNTLTERAAARGLKIREQRYEVTNGTLYPKPGMQVELYGARMFGTMDFEPIPGMPFPRGCAPSAGIRNSHDKSYALSILSGARVFVCSNGVLSAEHIISRKHTSRIDLRQSVDEALEAFMVSIRGFHETYVRLSAQRLSRAKGRSLAVDLAEAGAFASSDIVPVVAEFEHPRHAEFAGRTGWTLYQAATEVMKKQSPVRQVEGFKVLNQVLVESLN